MLENRPAQQTLPFALHLTCFLAGGERRNLSETSFALAPVARSH
jgi:hypothetical protein